MEQNTNLTLRVGVELKRKAKIKAIEKGVSLSEVVRHALEKFVKDCNGEDPEPAEMCRAMVA